MSDQHDQQEPNQAGQSETEAAESSNEKEMPDSEQADSGQQQSTSEMAAKESAGEQAASRGNAGEKRSQEQDSATQARADVAPAVDEAAQENNGIPAEQAVPEGDPQRMTANDMQQEPMSEQQLALEQWLRQVPDDPAGLLRRKFMVEHLMRQKRAQTP